MAHVESRELGLLACKYEQSYARAYDRTSSADLDIIAPHRHQGLMSAVSWNAVPLP